MMTDPMFETYDYAIGGKLVKGTAIMSEEFRMMIEDGNQEAIHKLKSDLIHQMASYMLENKLVEFTQVQDAFTYKQHVLIRAYLAPDEQVRILRLANRI